MSGAATPISEKVLAARLAAMEEAELTASADVDEVTSERTVAS